MRRTISSLLLTLIACGGTTPAPVIQHRPAPTTKVFGGARPVTLQVPDAYDNDIPTPLLILLHGYSASGDVQAAYLQYDKLVNEANMLLAAPNGTPDSGGKLFWNATDACCNFDHADVDDVAYIAKLITDISAQYNVDAKRVYLSGHSNGGVLLCRLAPGPPPRPSTGPAGRSRSLIPHSENDQAEVRIVKGGTRGPLAAQCRDRRSAPG